MDFTPNPPWVDRVLTKHWRELEAKVGAGMMPALESGGRYLPRSMGGRPSGKPSFKEFGCGHYGCVFPTMDTWRNHLAGVDDPGVVCKVTSDESEQWFVRTCMEQKWEWPAGMVEYLSLAILDDSHLKRPVAVLWRREADRVGKLKSYAFRDDGYDARQEVRLWRMLDLFKEAAGRVREKSKERPEWVKAAAQNHSRWPNMGDWPVTWEHMESMATGNSQARPLVSKIVGWRKAAQAVEAQLQTCVMVAQWMENESAVSSYIGQAFAFYMSKGILLADVHAGNVGLVKPEDFTSPVWTIVDPGHVVVLGSPVEGW